mmetsp:Transcript_37692/g.95273  ORF Transcript_37692/g.95273 Transcript_37692/m.95273 type:complete len:648 (-) Transcript_37692:1416-3359(-)
MNCIAVQHLALSWSVPSACTFVACSITSPCPCLIIKPRAMAVLLAQLPASRLTLNLAASTAHRRCTTKCQPSSCYSLVEVLLQHHHHHHPAHTASCHARRLRARSALQQGLHMQHARGQLALRERVARHDLQRHGPRGHAALDAAHHRQHRGRQHAGAHAHAERRGRHLGQQRAQLARHAVRGLELGQVQAQPLVEQLHHAQRADGADVAAQPPAHVALHGDEAVRAKPRHQRHRVVRRAPPRGVQRPLALVCAQQDAGAQAQRPQVGVERRAAAHDLVKQHDAVVHGVIAEAERAAVLERQRHHLRPLAQHRGVVQRGVDGVRALQPPHRTVRLAAALRHRHVLAQQHVERQLAQRATAHQEHELRKRRGAQPGHELQRGRGQRDGVVLQRRGEGRARAQQHAAHRLVDGCRRLLRAVGLGLVQRHGHGRAEKRGPVLGQLGAQLRQPAQHRDDGGARGQRHRRVLQRLALLPAVGVDAELAVAVGVAPQLQRAHLRHDHAALPQHLHQAVEDGGVGVAALLLHRLKRLQRAPPLPAALQRRDQRAVRDGVGLAALRRHLLKELGRLLPVPAVRARRDERVVGHDVGPAVLLVHLVEQLERQLPAPRLLACADERRVGDDVALAAAADHVAVDLQRLLHLARAAVR